MSNFTANYNGDKGLDMGSRGAYADYGDMQSSS